MGRKRKEKVKNVNRKKTKEVKMSCRIKSRESECVTHLNV